MRHFFSSFSSPISLANQISISRKIDEKKSTNRKKRIKNTNEKEHRSFSLNLRFIRTVEILFPSPFLSVESATYSKKKLNPHLFLIDSFSLR
jgi:hypothetical protein